MIHCDICIIGAGIAGVSLAARLAGDCDLVVLETERFPASHASGRSAAVFVPNYGDRLIRELTAESRSQFEAPDPAFWPTPLLSPRGLLRIVREDGLENYHQQLLGATGIEPLSMAAAAGFFPGMRAGRFVDASIEPDVHDIDADGLMQGYLRQAKSGACKLLNNAPAQRIMRIGSIWQIDTPQQQIQAPLLVNAAGAWADQVGAMAGLPSLGLQACRRSVAILPRPAALSGIEILPFVVPFPLGWYAKSGPGTLLISSAEEDPVEPADAWVDDLVLAQGMDRFSQDTGIEVQRVTSSWAGLRTFAPDAHPVIGFDPADPGFFWLAGQGGFGIQTAPALADMARRLLLREQVAPARARQVAVERLRNTSDSRGA